MSDASATGVIKRSISIAGHRTSISLEEPFWEELRLIASRRGVSVQRLVGEIDEGRAGENLSSALRVFVLREVQTRAAQLPSELPSPPASTNRD
jgi:predicted DNA-binding ribbon-helix-helix protein